MKKILFILFLITFVACQNATQDTDTASVPVQYASFGADTVQPDEAVTVLEAIQQAEEGNTENVMVTGVVSKVCKMKGCWMSLTTEGDETIRVTFKDYGFFVPRDISGSEVTLRGEMKRDTVSVETLQHFAKDEGKSQEEIDTITEASITWAIVADGVQVKDYVLTEDSPLYNPNDEDDSKEEAMEHEEMDHDEMNHEEMNHEEHMKTEKSE